MNIESLITSAIKASIIAGRSIMQYYTTTFQIEYKNDNSPLTSADKASHDSIVESLSNLDIQILSEEGKNIPYQIRSKWEYMWLVDPLDGTKEFINHNGEFTVNIALIKDGVPVLGVIYIPVTRLLYFGDIQNGAFKINIDDEFQLSDSALLSIIKQSEKLPIQSERPITILGSRSHQTLENQEFINRISNHFSSFELVSAGSSLKFCRVAEGAADIYPRLGPTMEWDTAAGHAICKSAGVSVYQYGLHKEIRYNKENLLNPWFIACRPEFENYI